MPNPHFNEQSDATGYSPNPTPWGGTPSQDRLRSIPDARERAIATQHTPPPPQAPPPTLQQTASTYQPREPSAESYAGEFPEITELYGDHIAPSEYYPAQDPELLGSPGGTAAFNQATPDMLFGFGSPFGESSGTTGSSQAVQDSLTFMMESELDKGYSPEEAALRAYGNFYNEGNLMDIPSDDPFFDTNRTIADDWIGRKETQMGQGSGGQQFFDPGYYDPRQDTFDKLRFLQAGLPQEQRQEQGFFDTMESAYQPDIDEALNKGIFSGAIGQGLFDPKGLRRLISSYGSGVAQPRYTNVARGGIISLVGE